MSLRDALSVAAAVIASLGGGAAIVLALSNWLGKVWANRLMEADEVLRTKLYLVEGREVPDSFYHYLQHAGQERDQRALWKRFRIDTSFLRGEPWPEGFYEDIRQGFNTAMTNHENCLAGLKA